MNFYKIDRRPIFPESWGDYGDILQHGMTAHLDRENGRLALERTGPYIPPITLPGISDIVITSAARKQLECSGLTGFEFVPVEKKLIVELPWESWDLTQDAPPQYPETGEPEDYILGQRHSVVAAAALGDVWELSVPRTVTIHRPTPVVKSYRDLRFDLSTWNGADLVRGSGYGGTLFSERAQEWFSERWGEYVRFDLFPTA